MRLLFLIPLGTGLILTYLSRSFEEEVVYLINVLTIISFSLSLIIAPWQIQLFILVVLLIKIQRFLPKIKDESLEVKTENPQSNQVENRTIKYRGVTYKLHSTETSITEGEIVGKYRGRVLHSHKLQDNLDLKQKSNQKYHLKYRGVNVNNSEKAEK
jgi:hypothetical protein